jgi:hypothetical protein
MPVKDVEMYLNVGCFVVIWTSTSDSLRIIHTTTFRSQLLNHTFTALRGIDCNDIAVSFP